MTAPSDDGFLHELELEVEAEVVQVELSRPEDAADLPVAEWLFDPADAEREEIGLRCLLAAVEVLEDDLPMEDDLPPGDPAA
jgi:hypothetical protein